MIDFNTVLNALLDQIIEQATLPLVRRIVELEEQVKSLVESPAANFESGTFRGAVRLVIDDYDFSDLIDRHERRYDHEEFMTNGDLKEVVKDIIDDDLEFAVTVS